MPKFNLSDQERKVIIICALALFVAVITFKFLSSSGTFQNGVFNFGGAIVGFIFTAILLNKIYGNKSYNDNATDRNTECIIKLIDGKDAILETMIEIIHNAKKYIYTIGGKSRDKSYLKTLGLQISRGDYRYIRIITGDHISHDLCKHLHDYKNYVEIGYFSEEKFGNVLVTHDTTFLALPSPSEKALDKGIKIIDEHIASDYRSYIAEILGGSDKEIDLEFIKRLCKTCRKKISGTH